MGLPGSGKTTLGKTIQKLTGAVRISSDEYRLMLFPEPKFTQKEHDNLYAMIDHNVQHLLEAGHSVIYDANLNRKHHRQEKYDLAKKFGADVKLWRVCVDEELAKTRRVAEQDSRLVPDGETSENMFDRIAAVIEAPNASEAHIRTDGSDITPDYVQSLLDS